MHKGITRYQITDPGWFYGEFRWMSHCWSKRGLISGKGRRKALAWYKRQTRRWRRRLIKQEAQKELEGT